MSTSYDVIKHILRTEKSTVIQKDRQYMFRVATTTTKPEIKKSVEEIYKVKVQAVNVVNVPGKRKRPSSWMSAMRMPGSEAKE